MRPAVAICLLVVADIGAVAADDTSALKRQTEQVLNESFVHATPEQKRTRLEQDETLALCSRYRNNPPDAIRETIFREARRKLRYPASGQLMGDWRNGAKLAAIGTGGHIGRLQPDPPDRARGGNCYACHALDPREVAAGNLGPSLTGYRKLRGASDESIKYTYEKIYNAQIYFACSNMPRFGHNGWLTPEQIADTVAYLLDADSPVNR